MERKADIQKTIYDNAKSHFLGNFPDSLPIEQAYVHIGMYLGWIIDQDMYSEYFEEEASIQIFRFKRREISCTILSEIWDGYLGFELFNRQGNMFTYYYYGGGLYHNDYSTFQYHPFQKSAKRLNFSNSNGMLKNILLKSLPELQREKQQDYRNVVITQIIIVTFGLTLSGPVLDDSTSGISKLIISVFFGFGTVYNFLLWDLLRNFTKSRILIIAIFFILIGMIIFGMLTEFPYYRFIEIDRRVTLLIVHGLLFPVEITIIGFAIRDIFMSQYFTPDKLWGSAAVFLMIGISFGSLYDLLCTINPGSLGVNIELGFPTYSECVNYSFCVLSGLDTGYPNPSRLIKNISVFEAVWGTLFSVLIIGKLLGLPKPEEQK